MYQNLYDLINQYIFNGAVVAESYTDLVCTLAATIGCGALVALPFVMVYWLCKFILRGFN